MSALMESSCRWSTDTQVADFGSDIDSDKSLGKGDITDALFGRVADSILSVVRVFGKAAEYVT